MLHVNRPLGILHRAACKASPSSGYAQAVDTEDQRRQRFARLSVICRDVQSPEPFYHRSYSPDELWGSQLGVRYARGTRYSAENGDYEASILVYPLKVTRGVRVDMFERVPLISDSFSVLHRVCPSLPCETRNITTYSLFSITASSACPFHCRTGMVHVSFPYLR